MKKKKLKKFLLFLNKELKQNQNIIPANKKQLERIKKLIKR